MGVGFGDFASDPLSVADDRVRVREAVSFATDALFAGGGEDDGAGFCTVFLKTTFNNYSPNNSSIEPRNDSVQTIKHHDIQYHFLYEIANLPFRLSRRRLFIFNRTSGSCSTAEAFALQFESADAPLTGGGGDHCLFPLGLPLNGELRFDLLRRSLNCRRVLIRRFPQLGFLRSSALIGRFRIGDLSLLKILQTTLLDVMICVKTLE